MGKYDHLTREELISCLERAELQEKTPVTGCLESERQIAQALLLMLKNHNSNYEEEIMRMVLEHFQADRAFLFQFNWENNTYNNIYEVNTEGISPEIQNLQNIPIPVLGDYLRLFQKGIPLVINRTAQISECSEQAKQIFQQLNVKSAILFPIHILNELWGFVGMVTIQNFKTWSHEDIEWLKTFTNILNIGISQRLFQTQASNNERSFNDLFENMPIAYVRHRLICDENNIPVNYQYIAANPAFEHFTGLKREQCIGKTVIDMGISSDPELFNTYKEIAFEGKQKEFDYFSSVLNKWFYSVLYSPKFGEFIALFYDITDQVQANERIQQNEKKIRTILENLPISVISFDSNGRFLDCNELAAQTFSRLQQPFSNKTLILSDAQRKILDDQRVFSLEFTFSPQSQKIISIENNTIPKDALYLSSQTIKYTDKNNQCLGYIFIAVDNTDLKKANLKLKNAQKALTENIVRLSLILESGQIYPWYMDLETGELDISKELYQAFGRTKDKKQVYTLKDIPKYIHPEDLKIFKKESEKLQNGQTKRIKLELRLNLFGKGYTWCEINAAVQARENMSKFTKCLGFLTIIQERKNNEQQLIESREKAKESDKLKSAFLANVSHEIRTPLNAIVGFSELIANSDNEQDKKYYLDIVKTNNNLLLNLINDILDLSKIESGRMDLKETRVNVGELCKELCLVHQLRAKADVKIVFENPDDPLLLYTDENRLTQLYSNLISNAIKNTYSGTISIGYRRKEKMIECYVRDTGQGIPLKKQKLIFNRFEKLNSNHQGFGLGLSICKSILDKMGGNISLTSEEGKGTEFRFQLPYRTTEKKSNISQPDKNTEKQTTQYPQATLLIAENNEDHYEHLKSLLGKTYKLLWAKTGIEAVELFGSGNPDLILMDMKIPELDGTEAVQIIREVSPDIPIIALTTFAYKLSKEEALKTGCNDFMTKPLDENEVKKLLKKYNLCPKDCEK